MATVSHITIDILDPVRVGRTSTLVRYHSADGTVIKQAAKALGMTKSQFMRTVLIKAARQVCLELKVKHAK